MRTKNLEPRTLSVVAQRVPIAATLEHLERALDDAVPRAFTFRTK